MSMLFTSTMIAFFSVIAVLVAGTVLELMSISIINFLIGCVFDILCIVALSLIEKYAAKKYDRTLSKMNNNLQGFFAEQQKFLQRPFISKKVRNMIKNNMAVTYIYNEQFIDALNLYKSMEQDIYANGTIHGKFIFSVNMITVYSHMGDMASSERYLNYSSTLLQEMKRDAFMKPYMINIYDTQLKLAAVETNFMVNRNPQTAKEMFDILQYSFNIKESNGFVLTETIYRYNMGVALAVIGNNNAAKEHFDYVIKNGGDLPCVNRAKKYLETGDTSILII